MRIHSTVILDATVELTIEDDTGASEGGEFVMLRSHLTTNRSRPVAEAQLEALRRARDVISAEMEAIQDLQERRS